VPGGRPDARAGVRVSAGPDAAEDLPDVVRLEPDPVSDDRTTATGAEGREGYQDSGASGIRKSDVFGHVGEFELPVRNAGDADPPIDRHVVAGLPGTDPRESI
jgi:hypothetical protein